MNTTASAKQPHHGQNVKRFRELFGLKQEALAIELGQNWTQKKVSRLEDDQLIEDDILEQVSEALKIPVAAIKNFTEESAISFFNTFNAGSVSHVVANYGSYHAEVSNDFIQMAEKNKALYEELLAARDKRIAELEALLAKK